MKKTIACFLLMLCFHLNAAAQTYFQKTFGSVNSDGAEKIEVLPDGNIAMAGYYDYGASDGFFLSETDSLGNPVMEKQFHGTGAYLFEHVSFKPLSGGGYVIIASALPYASGNALVYLVRTNSSGDTLWTKGYRATSVGRTTGYEIISTTDGGFAIAGSYEGPFDKDVYLLKTDSTGNLQWGKRYGGPDDEEACSLKQTADGGFILAGYTQSYGAGYQDVYLLKADIAGTLQWTKTYGSSFYEYARHIEITSDGGFILTGTSQGYLAPASLYRQFLLKTNASGNLSWCYNYGGSGNSGESGESVKQTSDGGYIITGKTTAFGNGLDDIYINKTDGNGNLAWSRAYGGTYSDMGKDIIQCPGGYCISGQSRNFSQGQEDAYLVKINSSGNGLCLQGVAGTLRSTPAWTAGTGGTETTGTESAPHALICVSAGVASANPCLCVPPTADFNVYFTHLNGSFDNYSTWADSCLWDFGDGYTSTAQEPNHTFPGDGTYTVSLIVTNDCGADTISYSILVESGVGIGLLQNDPVKLLASPNPFTEATTIRFDNKRKESFSLVIVNTLGLVVLRVDEITGSELQLSNSSLPKGFYFATLISGGKIAGSAKLIVD
jgi:PKD repeat protein